MNLTNYVREVSQKDFGKEFHHTATWNTRLRTTGGRFYHLYFEGKGYKHADADFKELLQKVDGLRYALTMPSEMVYHYYRCQKCGQEYRRKRRVNTQKYSCGLCHGKLLEIKSLET